MYKNEGRREIERNGEGNNNWKAGEGGKEGFDPRHRSVKAKIAENKRKEVTRTRK